MKTTYLLDGKIEFDFDSNLLINIENKDKKLVLPAPASRCLQLLLVSKKLITQQELFHYVWGENSNEITPNNLYQNISLLRKGLKYITSFDNDWIVTVPRKGFKFSTGISITELEKQKEEAITSIEKPRNLKYFFNKKDIIITLFTIFIFCFTFQLINKTFSSSEEVLESFVFDKKIGGCSIYINNDMKESIIHEKIFSIASHNCNKFPYVYITAYSILHSATILFCDKPINTSMPHCMSELIREFKI